MYKEFYDLTTYPFSITPDPQFLYLSFFFQAEDGIRDYKVNGVQTCALPIWSVCEDQSSKFPQVVLRQAGRRQVCRADRKSTRLNSSHLVISYAVFCLKKKKKQTMTRPSQRSRHNTSPSHL